MINDKYMIIAEILIAISLLRAVIVAQKDYLSLLIGLFFIVIAIIIPNEGDAK